MTIVIQIKHTVASLVLASCVGALHAGVAAGAAVFLAFFMAFIAFMGFGKVKNDKSV